MRSPWACLFLLVLAGCHTYVVRPPDPLTTEEILDLSKSGLPADQIIEKIRQSRTVYLMEAKDVIRLHEAGVDDKVIDCMLETERRAREERAYYGYWGYYGCCSHACYGHPWCWCFH